MILRKYFFLGGVCLALGSCADKLICPAYQSSFIHDKETLRKKFSYFYNDSTPKVYTASKTKYLVAVPESYRKRYREMQTINMQEIHPVVPDSILQPDELVAPKLDSLTAPLDSLGQIRADSVTAAASADSVYMITKDKEVRMLRYNFPDSLHYDSTTGRYIKESPYYYVDEVKYTTEQENYMWFFRKELILPDVRLSKSKAVSKDQPTGTQKKKGFFRKLMFWKKDRSDSVNVSPQPINNIDTRDSLSMWYDSSAQVAPNTNTPAPNTTKPKKKGFLGIFKKKNADPSTVPPKQPAKKEDNDQGF